MNETWKDVKGFSNYEISSNGIIKNKKRNSIKKTTLYDCGYVYINLYIGTKSFKKRLHRLIAEHFIENPENKPYVNHIDGNKLNNNIYNLEWVTASENTNHAIKKGLIILKDKEHMKKMNEASRKYTSTPIIAFKVDSSFYKEYTSVSECAIDLFGARHFRNKISSLLTEGKNKEYRGFSFKYK